MGDVRNFDNPLEVKLTQNPCPFTTVDSLSDTTTNENKRDRVSYPPCVSFTCCYRTPIQRTPGACEESRASPVSFPRPTSSTGSCPFGGGPTVHNDEYHPAPFLSHPHGATQVIILLLQAALILYVVPRSHPRCHPGYVVYHTESP